LEELDTVLDTVLEIVSVAKVWLCRLNKHAPLTRLNFKNCLTVITAPLF